MAAFDDIRNLYTCEPYNGENLVILSSVMEQRKYSMPIFITARQASKLGGRIKNGEVPTRIVYRSDATNSEYNYKVFNIAQVDGLERYCSKLLKIIQIQNEVKPSPLVVRKFYLAPLKIKRYFSGSHSSKHRFSFMTDVVGVSVFLIGGLLFCGFNEITLWLFTALGIYSFASF